MLETVFYVLRSRKPLSRIVSEESLYILNGIFLNLLNEIEMLGCNRIDTLIDQNHKLGATE